METQTLIDSSIFIVLLVVVLGAFYAFFKRES